MVRDTPSTRVRARASVRPWHQLESERVLHVLGSAPSGLTAPEARGRLRDFGANALAEREPPAPWRRYLRQFRSPLIYVLLVAAVVSFFVGERYDPYVILGIVLLNATIGYFQEARAEQALCALRRMTAPRAKVLREGRVHELPASEVVPGDVLVLEAGDRVAADARLLEVYELRVDESALTGESLPSAKDPAPLSAPDLPLGDRRNMVYMHTSVTLGRGRAVVVATGMASEVGAIAGEVASVSMTSPLLRQFRAFSRVLGASILGLIAVVLALGILRGLPPAGMFLVALSMAVSAIPEGLPIVVSVLLAVGVWRMARRNALIRNLPAVEALGSATVIATDKTGTLTLNQMTVQRLYVGGGWVRVTGEGYAPAGEVLPEPEGAPLPRAALRELAAASALCNDALLEEAEGAWRVLGDPTEGALQSLALKLGFDEDWPRLAEIPFASERRWMATLHEAPEGTVAYVKGALERLLPMAGSEFDAEGGLRPLDEAARARWQEAFEAMASRALRVLAVGRLAPPASLEALECPAGAGRLTLVGLVGMWDPPRPEAVEAVSVCQSAGIRVAMITGDHRVTASAIAERLGIARAGQRQVAEGREVEGLDEVQLAARVAEASVYARVSPAHKLRIVRALQASGEIVAMTGDGVNDAPALAQADIGVAMGGTGTEVAKGAADMVLVDDNFASIVAAVEEGRTIADNLRKVLHYLLSTTLAEILTISAAVAIGLPLPLLAVQILWINLVTDGVLDKALALERPEPGHMRKPPRVPGAPLVDRQMIRRMVAAALVMATGTLAVFAWELGRGGGLDRARTMAFVTLVAFQWFSAFVFRSIEQPLSRLGIFSNPWMLLGLAIAVALQLLAIYAPPLHAVLGTVPLSLGELARGVGVAASLPVLAELLKLALANRARQPNEPCE
ncbi:HAD-IC family P-type ATPase [bacterium]|nr:HAD-IC family P-type ATPase [bacterium]